MRNQMQQMCSFLKQYCGRADFGEAGGGSKSAHLTRLKIADKLFYHMQFAFHPRPTRVPPILYSSQQKRGYQSFPSALPPAISSFPDWFPLRAGLCTLNYQQSSFLSLDLKIFGPTATKGELGWALRILKIQIIFHVFRQKLLEFLIIIERGLASESKYSCHTTLKAHVKGEKRMLVGERETVVNTVIMASQATYTPFSSKLKRQSSPNPAAEVFPPTYASLIHLHNHFMQK